jgi:outer membrane immunogenic protein
MKYPVLAIIAAAAIASCSSAFAQSAPSTDAFSKRLDALERENRLLHDEVRLLKQGKASTATVAPPPPPTGSMAMATAPSRGPAYKAPSASPLPFSWTGLYVGAHFGGGLAQTSWTDLSPFLCRNTLGSLPCAANEAGSHNAVGPLGGGQLGYNWQFGRWVLGIEGQYSFAGLKGDHQNNALEVTIETLNTAGITVNSVDRLTSKVDGIGTIAGRIGFASESLDRTLFFVKGGAAFARVQFADQFNGALSTCSVGSCGTPITDRGAVNGSENLWGWMAGIGLEYGLSENWSANIEYNYLGFETHTVNLQGTQCFQVFGAGPLPCQSSLRPFDINQNMQLLKFGVNYHFN